MIKQPSKLSRFQTFVAIDINRSQILNAPYNPRKISESAANGLRKQLRKHGLVSTIVWNKRTGNIVGGHQRLSQLDILEKSKDYTITVSQIDVDIKQEKEINIVLNNQSIQGEFDLDLLKSIGDVNWDFTWFDDSDLNVLGIEEKISNIEENEKTKATKEDIDKIKAIKKESKEKQLNIGENYSIIMFKNIQEKELFMSSIGLDNKDRYIDSELIKKLINKTTI